MSDSLWPYGLQPTRLFCPWNFPGKNNGMGCHFFRQGIFPTQGSNPSLPHWQADSVPLSHLGTLWFLTTPVFKTLFSNTGRKWRETFIDITIYKKVLSISLLLPCFRCYFKYFTYTLLNIMKTPRSIYYCPHFYTQKIIQAQLYYVTVPMLWRFLSHGQGSEAGTWLWTIVIHGRNHKLSRLYIKLFSS